MDITAAVGPERLREIMAELADRNAAVVQRYGGTVDKFTGGPILVLGPSEASAEALVLVQRVREAADRLADGLRAVLAAAFARLAGAFRRVDEDAERLAGADLAALTTFVRAFC